jgi:hypothetical protein
MSIFDRIAEKPSNFIEGTNMSLLDGDTAVDNDTGEKYRFASVDTAEIDRYVGGEFQAGTAGGSTSTAEVSKLMNEFGYNNVKPRLDENGEILRDPSGRIIADFINDQGETFSSRLLSEGVLKPTKWSSNIEADIYQLGQLRRDQKNLQEMDLENAPTESSWDLARTNIEEAMRKEGFRQYGLKKVAHNEEELARAQASGVSSYYDMNRVASRAKDRTLLNEALNPYSDSWEQAWIGVDEAMAGLQNMWGDLTDNEYHSRVGKMGVERNRRRLAEYGTRIVDWRDVDDISSGIDYVVNNAAMSLPYMMIAAGSALAAPLVGTAAGVAGAGAAVTGAVTLGSSMLAPSAIYAAQTYNEMEGEKNIGIAVTSGILQGTLDRLGIGLIFKAGNPTKEVLSKALTELRKPISEGGKGLTLEAAQAMLSNASKKTIADFTKDAANAAKSQLTGKAIFKDLATRGIIGGAGEAFTEGLQEATAYTAATLGSDKVFDYNELTDRMIDGAIAGGVLGTSFSAPGAAVNAGIWADIAVRQAPADAKRLSDAGRYAEEERARSSDNRIVSIEEGLDNIYDGTQPTETVDRETGEITEYDGNYFEPLDIREQEHKGKKVERSIGESIGAGLAKLPKFWRGSVNYLFPDEVLEKSRSARFLKEAMGGGLQKIFNGNGFENFKFNQVATYKNMIMDPTSFYSILNNGRITSATKKAELSDKTYANLRSMINKDGTIDPSKLPPMPEAEKQVLITLANQAKEMSDRMYRDQNEYVKRDGKELGYINNYLLRFKALDKVAIKKNRAGFEAALQSETNLSVSEAKELTDKILDNPEMNDLSLLDDNFSVTKGGIVPTSHKERTLNLSEKDAFNEFMERDIFANMSTAAKSAARFVTHRKYIGKNGEILAAQLQQMENEGVPRDKVNEIAMGLKDFLDAESGNYKRPTSKDGKIAIGIQKNLMFVTTIATLGLATVASLVELALAGRALTAEQIYGRKGAKSGDTSLASFGKELAKVISDAVMFAGNTAVLKDPGLGSQSRGQELIRSLGYYEWDVGAATVTGVTEMNPVHEKYYKLFFKMTGLTGWTNMTRALRGSIAADYMFDHTRTISEYRNRGGEKTNEVQEAEEALRNIGVNVDDAVEVFQADQRSEPNAVLSPELEAKREKNMRTGAFNFINDAVALPTVANRPMIYQDPRFALFTQFQGFIATFTANHIPKLWGEYVKRGTPSMKYNAFAVMTTMIMLGFASQYLKDLIKFGDRDEDELKTLGNPYLDTGEYVQRGIRASGLMGVGERVFDQFFPLYEQRSDNALEWAWNTVSGEAPAAGTVKRVARTLTNLGTGDFGGAAQQASKLVPFIGIVGGAERLSNLYDWDYKGEDNGSN